MGLDVGARRIGYAFATLMDEGKPLVVPAGYLEVGGEQDALEKVLRLVREESVESMVVGMPYRDGSETGQSRRIGQFAEKISALLPDLEMNFWDESLTSYGASAELVEADLKHSGKSKRGRVDSLAAALILQGFLSSSLPRT